MTMINSGLKGLNTALWYKRTLTSAGRATILLPGPVGGGGFSSFLRPLRLALGLAAPVLGDAGMFDNDCYDRKPDR